MKKFAYWFLGIVFGLFFLMMLIGILASNLIDEENKAVETEGNEFINSLFDESLEKSYLWNIQDEILTTDFLNSILPIENKKYFDGRFKSMAFNKDRLNDNWLVIELKVNYDAREEYETTSDYYDKLMILEITQNIINKLISLGHNPDKSDISIRVSATIDSVNKSPTGKSLVESRGTARYIPGMTAISYKNRAF